MKKLFIKFMLTALTFGMLASLNTMASESKEVSSITIGEDNSIYITSENAGEAGITAVQLTLRAEPAIKDATVSFDFNPDNDIKVTDFRWHNDDSTITIYLADEKSIFDSDSLTLGTVSAKDVNNNYVDVRVTVVENSLKLVSQNKITEKEFSIDDKNAVGITTEIPKNPLDTPGDIVSVETVTTTSIKGDSKSVNVEKTYPTSYMITIPDSTDNLNVNDSFVASAENVLIEHGKSLRLSVESTNGWELRDKNNPTNDESIAYSMGYGDRKTAIESDSQTIMTLSGDETDEVTLTVISIDSAKMAGTFFDTLTFRVEIS